MVALLGAEWIKWHTTFSRFSTNRPPPPAAPAGRPAFAFVDPSTPQLSALDLGATRGDGIFETISVGNGQAAGARTPPSPIRFVGGKLDLPAPDLDAWRAAILAASTNCSRVPRRGSRPC